MGSCPILARCDFCTKVLNSGQLSCSIALSAEFNSSGFIEFAGAARMRTFKQLQAKFCIIFQSRKLRGELGEKYLREGERESNQYCSKQKMTKILIGMLLISEQKHKF